MTQTARGTDGGLTIQSRAHFTTGGTGRKRMMPGEAPEASTVERGRAPRLARLMALAIRFDGLVRDGQVADYADLARLGHVTRARMTQIINLLNLAPDIQEAILVLPRTEAAWGSISERRVRCVAAEPDWQKQRRAWQRVSRTTR